MSLITIIAKNSNEIRWANLLYQIEGLSISGIEVFPIPKELGFEESAIGIAVPSNYESKQNIIDGMSKLVKLLTTMSFEITELYNGELINYDNIKKTLLTLL